MPHPITILAQGVNFQSKHDFEFSNTDRPSRFNQKSGDWKLNKMNKPVAYHGWKKKKFLRCRCYETACVNFEPIFKSN